MGEGRFKMGGGGGGGRHFFQFPSENSKSPHREGVLKPAAGICIKLVERITYINRSNHKMALNVGGGGYPKCMLMHT